MWRKFKQKEHVIKSPKRSSEVLDFVELTLKRSQFHNVTDNRNTERMLQMLKQKIKMRS